jgi:hypothetical protein
VLPKKSSAISLQKLNSFELFEEKKAMVKKYTAHQSLRAHSLEAQRLDAKSALKARVEKKKLRATGESLKR